MVIAYPKAPRGRAGDTFALGDNFNFRYRRTTRHLRAMSTAENPLRSGQLLVLPLAMVVGAFILWNQAEQGRKRGDPETSCLNNSTTNGVRNGNGSRASSYTRSLGVPPHLTEQQKEALAATAQALATRGKGILAADESTRTVRERDCLDGQ